VCGAEFEVHFRYQLEERVTQGDDGQPRVAFEAFCSQRCLERSHHSRGGGLVSCEACTNRFQVELVSQVLFTGGRRHYACSSECRARIRDGMRTIRLGELLKPGAEQLENGAAANEFDALPSRPLDDELESAPDATSSPPPARPAQGWFDKPVPTWKRKLRDDAPRVIAVFNHKGGTGKTTTAITFAAGLAERGQHVLLVDADAQGNVAVCLGAEVKRSLYHVLVMGLPIAHVAESIRPGLDLLPSNETLAAAELYLAGRANRHGVLAQRLMSARRRYDVVVVDCSPSLSLLNQNALVMADGVLCPVACDYLSLVGVRQVLRTLKQVNKHFGHAVRLWGVLPTMFDARARICREALDALRGHFGTRCFDPVRLQTRVKEAPAQHKSLLEYAPGSGAAEDYLKTVERMLEGSSASTAAQELTGGVA